MFFNLVDMKDILLKYPSHGLCYEECVSIRKIERKVICFYQVENSLKFNFISHKMVDDDGIAL